MNLKKILQSGLALAVAGAAVYFFYLQFEQNADVISAYNFKINFYHILSAIIFGIFSVLVGPYVWQLYVNDYVKNKLNYFESFSLFCSSAMLKYIPGKIWHYAAQITLMSSRGISNAVLIYINLVCFIGFMFVSAIFAAYYYLFSMKILAWNVSLLIFALLIFLDVVFIVWNTSIINFLIAPLSRLLKIEIQPIRMKKSLFVYAQALYFFAYMLMGAVLYFLAQGIGLGIPFPNIFSIMATISVAAMSTSVAFFSIGGLGIREGAMFFTLKQFSDIQTALILPIAARLLCLVVELLAGIVAIFIGIKYDYFPKMAAGQPKEIIAEEVKLEAHL